MGETPPGVAPLRTAQIIALFGVTDALGMTDAMVRPPSPIPR